MKQKIVSIDPTTGLATEDWVDLGQSRARPKRSNGRHLTGETRGHASRATRRRVLPRGEFVYFLQQEDVPDGPIKIGCTRNLDQRLAGLRSGCPVPLRLLGIIAGYEVTEKCLHEMFASDRLHGEWFRCTPTLAGLASGALILVANGRLRPRTARDPQPALIGPD